MPEFPSTSSRSEAELRDHVRLLEQRLRRTEEQLEHTQSAVETYRSLLGVPFRSPSTSSLQATLSSVDVPDAACPSPSSLPGHEPSRSGDKANPSARGHASPDPVAHLLRSTSNPPSGSSLQTQDLSPFFSSVLSNLTHEVRTPLTAILGFTTVLRSGIDARYERFVHLIERSGQRLLLMLDSLLDLAQLETGTMTMPVSEHCVRSVLHSLSGTLQTRVEDEGLAFRLDVPSSGRVCARFNEDLLARVLTHLVDNAVKFTTEGHVALSLNATDAHVDIAVEDTGLGMADDFVPHAFDAFTQESQGPTRTHQGSGLGLTVSRRIMEYMQGSIHIDTAKSHGTIITLRLKREPSC